MPRLDNRQRRVKSLLYGQEVVLGQKVGAEVKKSNKQAIDCVINKGILDPVKVGNPSHRL